MNQSEVWISNKVFDWFMLPGGTVSTNNKDLMRAYELWHHAEAILSTKSNELHRVDAISTLKRCLNQRLKFMESVYGFRKVTFPSLPKGYLELLESFGLVRPLMLKKLMEIRNHIEHDDTSPPDIDRCLELLDLTWYFLKSTDEYLFAQRDDFCLQEVGNDGEKTQYSLEVNIDYDLNHQVEVRAWVPNYMICGKETANHFKVFVEKILAIKEREADFPDLKEMTDEEKL